MCHKIDPPWPLTFIFDPESPGFDFGVEFHCDLAFFGGVKNSGFLFAAKSISFCGFFAFGEDRDPIHFAAKFRQAEIDRL